MALTTNFQISGLSASRRDRIAKAIGEQFRNREGKWHVQFIAAYSDDLWEVRLSGPSVETSSYVDGVEAQQNPDRLAEIILDMAT